MEFGSLVGLFVEYGYFLVFVAVFLDNAGLPVPGELVLLAFGFVARAGQVSAGWGLLAASAGAIAGDTMSYWLGRLAGTRVLHTYCPVFDEEGRTVGTDEYRVVVLLRDVEELSNEEVADLLGLSVAAVKSRLHRARLVLRHELAGLLSPAR